jgi:hypothetical protein
MPSREEDVRVKVMLLSPAFFIEGWGFCFLERHNNCIFMYLEGPLQQSAKKVAAITQLYLIV